MVRPKHQGVSVQRARARGILGRLGHSFYLWQRFSEVTVKRKQHMPGHREPEMQASRTRLSCRT